jgi:hypothetical protein
MPSPPAISGRDHDEMRAVTPGVTPGPAVSERIKGYVLCNARRAT